MALPRTWRDMQNASYRLLNDNAHCRDCRDTIQWWQTTHGKKLAFNPPAPGDSLYNEAILHSATCKGRGERPLPGPVDLHKEAERIARQLGLRLVVLFSDTEEGWFHRQGQPGEDLRSDCITAGNKIRQQLNGGRRQ